LVKNNIDVSFGIDYDFTPSKYYKTKTINDLLEQISTYIEEYNHDKFINGYKDAGF
jgi:hypothetical protein